ncbi:hypothetical protein E2C01_009358 [Portunus trituberculatus]|uniref:Uncharacterized protein n=1 Tax=Portunus trituberculatus TaxID=210409 RepID=A0A5B7D4E7_PORTR|nr:hypothetical protein [Portunus trituberculatus]
MEGAQTQLWLRAPQSLQELLVATNPPPMQHLWPHGQQSSLTWSSNLASHHTLADQVTLVKCPVPVQGIRTDQN